MRHSFITERFLAGHSSAFRYAPKGRVNGVGSKRFSTAVGERSRRLRNRKGLYLVRTQAALIAALLLLIGVFRADFQSESEFLVAVDEVIIHEMEDIEQTEHIEKPPPPPRPPVPIEVPNDEILEEEILALDAEINFDEPLDVPPPPPTVEDEEPEIFVIVEEPPEMIGGVGSLYEVLKYPEVARLAGLEGSVIVQILIDEAGVPSNAVILRSAGQILNDAAVEALLKQRFTPGRQRGKAVRVQMAFPVNFRLG